jgi:hypothetical protein
LISVAAVKKEIGGNRRWKVEVVAVAEFMVISQVETPYVAPTYNGVAPAERALLQNKIQSQDAHSDDSSINPSTRMKRNESASLLYRNTKDNHQQQMKGGFERPNSDGSDGEDNSTSTTTDSSSSSNSNTTTTATGCSCSSDIVIIDGPATTNTGRAANITAKSEYQQGGCNTSVNNTLESRTHTNVLDRLLLGMAILGGIVLLCAVCRWTLSAGWWKEDRLLCRCIRFGAASTAQANVVSFHSTLELMKENGKIIAEVDTNKRLPRKSAVDRTCARAHVF